MIDPNTFLERLQKSLKILEQRRAKYGIDAPASLVLETEDHYKAIILTEQLAAGYLTEIGWREGLKPLLVNIENREATEIVTALNIGGVTFSQISNSTITTGDITTTITAGGDIVGRDKIINNITHIKERALSAAEEAAEAKAIARQELAHAVIAYVEDIEQIATGNYNVLQGGPYRGLQAYTLQEAEIFFGRDKAMTALLSHLQQGRLTILHAESGAGKSSLLKAGIQYQLIVQGHVPIYIRPYDKSPVLAIKKIFLPSLDSLPELAGASLRDYLYQVTNVLGGQTILVILIDQFEEFFFLLKEEERNAFIDELAICLEDDRLKVRWVLALRAEFFSNLTNFSPRIPNPISNHFRLNRLLPEQSRTVITEPADRIGIAYEPTLVDVLLDDLSDFESNKIDPAQLQLVCLALYKLLPQRQQNSIPAEITLKMYNTEGQAEGILRGHLNRELTRTIDPQKREIARQLLNALVSSDGRRVRRPKNELAATIATKTSVDDILDRLVESRLLSVDRNEETWEAIYELTHDYLIAEIEIDPELQTRKAARELLKQEVQAFKRHETLLDQKKFNIIDSEREFLILDDDAVKLLHLSQKAIDAEVQAREAQRQRELRAEAGKNIRTAAIYGLLAGGLGLSLTYLVLFLPQSNAIRGYDILIFATILRMLPGAIAGLLFVLFVSRIEQITIAKDYLNYLAAGAGSGAFALVFHTFLRQSELLGLLWAVLLGALWGGTAGLAIGWSRDRSWWQGLALVGLAGGLTLWLGDWLTPGEPFGAIPILGVYWLAGALFPLSLWAVVIYTKSQLNKLKMNT